MAYHPSVRRGKPASGITGIPAAEEKRAAVQKGLDELDAGLFVPIEEVEAWIKSWDTPDELPMPEPRKAR